MALQRQLHQQLATSQVWPSRRRRVQRGGEIIGLGHEVPWAGPWRLVPCAGWTATILSHMAPPSDPTDPATGSAIGSPTAPGTTSDWPKKAADLVDLLADVIHDRAVRPVMLAARIVVFGLIVAVLSLVVLALLSISLVRMLDVYAFGGRVWISYAVLGAAFTLLGLLAWSRRSARPAPAAD